MTYDIGEPYQSRLLRAIEARDRAPARDKARANHLIRSIRLEAARSKGVHTEMQWLAFVASFGSRCVMCGTFSPSLQKDHVVPIYQGGSDGMDNLQPLCQPCNAAKGPDSTNWAAYRIQNGFEE